MHEDTGGRGREKGRVHCSSTHAAEKMHTGGRQSALEH